MANRKDLKRAINSICSALFSEGVAASLYNGQADQADVEALLSSIIAVNSDYITRVSHPEPGIAPKVYFKTLRESFSKQVTEIVDQINNL